MTEQNFTASGGQRLDKFLTSETGEAYSRSYIEKLNEEGHILVNGKKVKSGFRLRPGDTVRMEIPDAKPLSAVAEDIPLDIVYEDQDLLIINKPKGMVVHPAPGHDQGTLVNAVMAHCGDNLSSINGVYRPGIVHRIDKNTTGLLVVCKNNEAHQSLAAQLKVHSITRVYAAIVLGRIREDDGTISAPIGRSRKDRKKQAIDYEKGRNAVTHYHVLERFEKYTLVECRLETGRTHQIRVHMASIGYPVLGDDVYGPRKCEFHLEGQCLHAGTLGFIHPRTKEYIEFHADYPEYFQKLLEKLRKG